MRRFFEMMRRFFQKGQRGFTLVELLVVVGIIVALAAVIIPTVTQFAGKGEEGARDAEVQNVQAAMDTMMTDKGILSVIPSVTTPGSSTNDWSVHPYDIPVGPDAKVALGPNGGSGGGYLRKDDTAYCYTWDASGLITQTGKWDSGTTTCIPFP